MELFIQIRDGKPFEHPILLENLLEVYPEFDPASPPDGFVRFERVVAPNLGPYEILESSTYAFIGGIVKDFHTIRSMTSNEKTEQQARVKDWWASMQGSPSWTFDEDSCSFMPPIPYPNNGKTYQWDEATTNWIEVTND